MTKQNDNDINKDVIEIPKVDAVVPQDKRTRRNPTSPSTTSLPEWTVGITLADGRSVSRTVLAPNHQEAIRLARLMIED